MVTIAVVDLPFARPLVSVTIEIGGHFVTGTILTREVLPYVAVSGVEGAELHRFRKTYADTLHEEGMSVNTIRIRLGHESLDVTLAYLKGKDAESEESQEHANSSSLAL
jgi:integrase